MQCCQQDVKIIHNLNVLNSLGWHMPVMKTSALVHFSGGGLGVTTVCVGVTGVGSTSRDKLYVKGEEKRRNLNVAAVLLISRLNGSMH